MNTYLMYECCLCGYASRDQKEILTCELAGTPLLPAWARSRVGQRVRGFGEDGVRWGVLRNFELRRDHFGNHFWFAIGDFQLSHNQRVDEGGVPFSALNPMHGWDFLRFADEIEESVREWFACCVEYGIKPDPTRSTWLEMLGSACQQMILEIAVECEKASIS